MFTNFSLISILCDLYMAHEQSPDGGKILKITKIVIFMKLRPPSLIQFSNKQLDELNTPFAPCFYNEDLIRGGGHMISQDGGKVSKITKIIIFMKLRPPNLIHFSDKQINELNMPFA